MLQIFILLDSLSVLLNIIAWIIIVVNMSKMKLHEPLCDSPGDCPIVFNIHYVQGLVISTIGAIFVYPLPPFTYVVAHCKLVILKDLYSIHEIFGKGETGEDTTSCSKGEGHS